MNVTEKEAKRLRCVRALAEPGPCIGSQCMAWSVIDPGLEYAHVHSPDPATRQSKLDEKLAEGWEIRNINANKITAHTTIYIQRQKSDPIGQCGLANFTVEGEK